MNLYQYKKGYRYTSDAMFLYDFARNFRPKGSVLDVGCGCGVLGLLLKRDFPSISLSSIDIQEDHLILAQKSSEENALRAEFILGDFRTYKFDKQFDMIVSNPPYYHEHTKKSEDERLKISRYADFLPLNDFFIAASKSLKANGDLVFCYESRQIENILIKAKANGLKVCDICFIHSKADKESFLALIRAKKSSNAYAKIYPPFFVFEEGKYTKRAKDIFLKADTRSIDWQ